MVRKCSVGGCKSNYKSQLHLQSSTITVYGFPKDKVERQRWLAALPNIIEPSRLTANFGVCAKHFPSDIPMVRRGSSMVPSAPPSIFFNVPSSSIPTAPAESRPTTKSSSDVRSRTMDIDEMADFNSMDKFGPFDSFISSLKNKYDEHSIALRGGKSFVILSNTRVGPVHDFSIYCDIYFKPNTKIVENIKCELFRKLKNIHHPNIQGNHVTRWSQLEEMFRFVRLSNEDSEDIKEQFLLRQCQLQNSSSFSGLYSMDDLCLALQWCTRSRSLYGELRNFLRLPSFTTLSRITRAIKNTSDEDMYRKVFENVEERSKNCILIIDEIYVKASLSYCGGVMFGYAVDQPDKKATTLLCMMVKCMFNGPKFLAKLLPCAGLKATFQYECAHELIKVLHKCGANVTAIVNDNNRLNQSFFRMFKPSDPERPWVVLSPTSTPLFLLYDPVHLIKNIRNNWYTEGSKSIILPCGPEGANVIGKWTDLEELVACEAQSMVKLSKLTKASIAPSNIEKQKVSLALQVFSDETCSALRMSTSSNPSWKETAALIEEVIKLWKVFSCKTPSQGIRKRDIDRAVITMDEIGERGLSILHAWAQYAEGLCPDGRVRKLKLTKDTAQALSWTCKCVIDLSNYLLSSTSGLKHDFVCVGFFLQDDIERHFGYFRMAAGSNYYLTVQDIMNIHAKDSARLMLKIVAENSDDFDFKESFHKCDLCLKPLSDSELLLIDDMSMSSIELSVDEKQALFYIAGYVASKSDDPALLGFPEEISTEVHSFLNDLNRGGLTYPSNNLFTIALLCFYFFRNSNDHSCRNRFTNIATDFTNIFHLDFVLPKKSARCLANIFFKRFCMFDKQETNSNKKRKISKLSSQ